MEDSESTPRNSDPNYHLRRAQMWEIVSAVAFTLGVGVLWQGIRAGDIWLALLAAMTLALSVLSFFGAARRSSRADELTKDIIKRSLYLISPHRIETLKQVKAPKDVTDVLETMNATYSEDELLRSLRFELGVERTTEVKDIVLKYTKVTPEPLEPV